MSGIRKMTSPSCVSVCGAYVWGGDAWCISVYYMCVCGMSMFVHRICVLCMCVIWVCMVCLYIMCGMCLWYGYVVCLYVLVWVCLWCMLISVNGVHMWCVHVCMRMWNMCVCCVFVCCGYVVWCVCVVWACDMCGGNMLYICVCIKINHPSVLTTFYHLFLCAYIKPKDHQGKIVHRIALTSGRPGIGAERHSCELWFSHLCHCCFFHGENSYYQSVPCSSIFSQTMCGW